MQKVEPLYNICTCICRNDDAAKLFHIKNIDHLFGVPYDYRTLQNGGSTLYGHSNCKCDASAILQIIYLVRH